MTSSACHRAPDPRCGPDDSTASSPLVVGCRGRSSLTGYALGSASRAVIHQAPCPVLVVRGKEDER
ncbi:universal stress protein [Actinosynnema sp. NPDC002837]